MIKYLKQLKSSLAGSYRHYCNLINPRPFLGLNQIFKTDVFIVSYPRSGNTWVRFLIANLLYPEKTITFRNIEQIVPNLYVSKKFINSTQTRRFIKTHYCFFNAYPKLIYIYRDGRAALASHYIYVKQNNYFNGDFSMFLKERLTSNKVYETLLPWHAHVSEVIKFSRRHPERILLLRYETMKKSPIECVRKIANFCGLYCNDADIRCAVARCSFEKLKQIEKQYGPEREDKPQVTFFRSGTDDDWENLFSRKDKQLFLSKAGWVMRQLNYIE